MPVNTVTASMLCSWPAVCDSRRLAAGEASCFKSGAVCLRVRCVEALQQIVAGFVRGVERGCSHSRLDIDRALGLSRDRSHNLDRMGIKGFFG
eukprot:1143852-Pelagomonas_calceolata.AAC.2